MTIANPFEELAQLVRSQMDELVACVESSDFTPHPWSAECAAYLACFNAIVETLIAMNAHVAASIPKLRKAHARALKAMGPAPGGKA